MALALVSACAGAQQPAASPEAPGEPCAGLPENCGSPPPSHTGEEQAPARSESGGSKSVDAKGAEAAPPPFKENGSVLEAINAVPQGTPRLNVEQEALGRPLGNVELYEPCKPAQNAHFKAKVAVWDGKAVGLDLTTTPKNQKFAECIAERIRSITWQDKVKSLNIVEYTF